MAIRVGIADDHPLVINGLKAMLKRAKQIEVVCSAISGEDLLRELDKEQPDVLLLDIRMPGLDGLELCKRITNVFPTIQVIAITNHDESFYVKQMLRNGASGYLLKNTDQSTLIHAIETVFAGNQFLDEQIKSLLLDEVLHRKKSSGQVSLTRRETEILELIAKEFSNQEIADKLFISLRTVETHRFNITQKLQVKNTAGLIKEAYKRGLS